MALEGVNSDQLKREGVAAETIRYALLPILEREFERSLNALEAAKDLNEFCSVRADIKIIRQIVKQLDSKYRLSKE